MNQKQEAEQAATSSCLTDNGSDIPHNNGAILNIAHIIKLLGLVLSLPDEVTTDDADITDADEAKSDSIVDLLDCFKTL